MGRTAYGVRGISLRDDDSSWRWKCCEPGGTILTVTEQGYGKRTELDEYRVQSRGGIGIINIQTSDRNGKVVGIIQVSDDDELMLITQQGKILRMASHDIRTIGRATQGVTDRHRRRRSAVSIARLAEKDDEEQADATIRRQTLPRDRRAVLDRRLPGGRLRRPRSRAATARARSTRRAGRPSRAGRCRRHVEPVATDAGPRRDDARRGHGRTVRSSPGRTP